MKHSKNANTSRFVTLDLRRNLELIYVKAKKKYLIVLTDTQYRDKLH